jgi:hypothetical protein
MPWYMGAGLATYFIVVAGIDLLAFFYERGIL